MITDQSHWLYTALSKFNELSLRINSVFLFEKNNPCPILNVNWIAHVHANIKDFLLVVQEAIIFDNDIPKHQVFEGLEVHEKVVEQAEKHLQAGRCH